MKYREQISEAQMTIFGNWATVCLCTWWGGDSTGVLRAESPEEEWRWDPR